MTKRMLSLKWKCHGRLGVALPLLLASVAVGLAQAQSDKPAAPKRRNPAVYKVEQLASAPLDFGYRIALVRDLKVLITKKRGNRWVNEWMPIEELNDEKIAEVVRLTQGTLILGSFPHAKQLNEITDAIKSKVYNESYYRRLEVQRRQIHPSGQNDGNWATIQREELKTHLRTVQEWDEEKDPTRQLLLETGDQLVIRLPKPARGQYPDLVNDLPQIKSTIGYLRNDPKAQPEFCFVRFLDLTLPAEVAGLSFEYRVRVVLDNPNYKRVDEVQLRQDAEFVELVGEWSEPVRVTFPTLTTADFQRNQSNRLFPRFRFRGCVR